MSTDDNDPSTNRSYGAIHLYVFYGNNLNTAYFDGIQFAKDDGQSYVYDNDGNLTNAKSAAEKSGFVYDRDDNLAKLTDPTGTSYEYGYDSKKNLQVARNSEGSNISFPTTAMATQPRPPSATTALPPQF